MTSRRSRPRARGLTGLLLTLLLTGGCAGAQPSSQGSVSSDAQLLAQFRAADQDRFRARYPDAFVEISEEPGLEGIAVTDYDPTKLPPPSHQRVVSYGRLGSSMDDLSRVVYSVSIRDKDSFYTVEFDGKTREQVLESGTWFLTDLRRDTYVADQLATIDFLLAGKD